MDNIIVIILIIFAISVGYYMFNANTESFGKDGIEFPELGEKRYGLRGELLDTRPMCDCLCNKYGNCYNGNNY